MEEAVIESLVGFDRHKLSEFDAIVGVDEAGRGPLAGPVVAAAVLLRRDAYERSDVVQYLTDANDSKKLSPEKRVQLFGRILGLVEKGQLCYAVKQEGVKAIEELNILGATKRAMQRALDELLSACTLSTAVLVDGLPLKNFTHHHEGVVGGDGKSFAIALASIIAKVQRDRIMMDLHADYPVYGFDRHKGYGTREHRDAIHDHGPCPHHRPLFLRKILGNR